MSGTLGVTNNMLPEQQTAQKEHKYLLSGETEADFMVLKQQFLIDTDLSACFPLFLL